MQAQSRGRDGWLAAASIVAVVFGLLTIKEGGSVLFGGEEARRAAGAYVPFVLWFNFLAGFAYVAAGIGLWGRHRWAAALAFAIAGGTLLTYLMFGVHVATGGAYEKRTVFAMALRSAVWVAISIAAYRRCRVPASTPKG
ncbi:MAG TPA: hypothetical protein VF038_02470 [Usitatibacter sp.]|jgi:hypothetical protein